MRKERHQPTRRELAAITSQRPVVRRIRPEEFRRFVEGVAGAGDSNANEKKEEVTPNAKRRRS